MEGSGRGKLEAFQKRFSRATCDRSPPAAGGYGPRSRQAARRRAALLEKALAEANEAFGGIEIEWTTLDEYLEYLVEKGISPNVASFIGATSVRIHEIGFEDRAPDADELERMQQLVRQAMEDGALGLGSSLIYAPAFYADTEE